MKKMKAMLRETKENVQGTNSDAKETGTQINGVDQKEERNIQPEKNKETRIQKNEERLRNLQDIFKHSNIWIIGVPEEEEEQEMGNLFEKKNSERELLQSGKGNRLPGSPGSSESPKEAEPRRNTPRHIIIILAKMKQKVRILEAAREKDTVTYKGLPIRLSADFSKETFQARRG